MILMMNVKQICWQLSRSFVLMGKFRFSYFFFLKLLQLMWNFQIIEICHWIWEVWLTFFLHKFINHKLKLRVDFQWIYLFISVSVFAIFQQRITHFDTYEQYYNGACCAIEDNNFTEALSLLNKAEGYVDAEYFFLYLFVRTFVIIGYL